MEPAGKYVRTNQTDPEAYGICDLCGLRFNHRDLRWNFEWSGIKLYNTHSLRCWRCVDVPQEQLRTIILPPDPPPIINARTENFYYEEQTVLIAQFAIGAPKQPTPNAQPPWGAGPQLVLCTQDGEMSLIMQYLTSS